MESRIDKVTGEFPIRLAMEVVKDYNTQNNIQQKSPLNGGGNWINAGPSSSWSGYSGVGRLNCISFHPSDNNTFGWFTIWRSMENLRWWPKLDMFN